jgi:glycolate oxidase iron-sulfur subunit
MRALDEGRTSITDPFVEHMYTCLDCRACETACPSGVGFGSMMELTRARIVAERAADPVTTFLMKHVFPYPWRFNLASRFLQFYSQRPIQRLVRRTGLLDWLRPGWARLEEMTPEVEMATGVETGTTYPAAGPSAGTVAFFSGCVMNSLLGNVNRATVELLNAAGYDVVVPDGQICCGALANHAGLRETATAMARRNLETFSGEFEAIIVNASGCSAMLAEYPLLLDGAEEFSSRIEDIASFLARAGVRRRRSAPRGSGGRPLRVGYDDPCHLLHAMGVRQAPRELLGAVPGIELVELPGADECCGSAGIYNITHHHIAMEVLDRKMDRVRGAGLDVLVTGNPGCLFQLQYGARRHGLDLEVVHIAEFLERSLPGRGRLTSREGHMESELRAMSPGGEIMSEKTAGEEALR